jgi:two-component system, LuxR family, sensor kinase FixL
VRCKLFHPFVTTKAAGMGFGLSMCRSVIAWRGGQIWVSDNRGGGTVFDFTVPSIRVSELSDPAARAAHLGLLQS